jgi:hypothetical protein
LEFFDVGVVDAEAELVEFGLNLLNHFVFEYSALAEKFFHGHVGHDAAGFALDDAFDDLLDVVAARGDGDCALGCSGWRSAIGFTGEEDGVLLESVLAVLGADGEYGGKTELQLFHSHGLDAHAEVEGGDADLGDFLEGVYESLVSLANIVCALQCTKHVPSS